MLSKQRRKYIVSETILLNFIPFFGVVFFGWDIITLYMTYISELCAMSFVIYFRVLFQGVVFKEIILSFIIFIPNSIMFFLSGYGVFLFFKFPEWGVSIQTIIYVFCAFLVVYVIDMFREIFGVDSVVDLFFANWSFSEGVQRRRKEIMRDVDKKREHPLMLIVLEPYVYFSIIVFAAGAAVFVPAWIAFVDLGIFDEAQSLAIMFLFFIILFRTLFIIYKEKTKFKNI